MAQNQRADRATEERTERRRQRGATTLPGTRLGVDESKLDRVNYEYRWVNDRGPRMAQMHADDWDPAPEAAALHNEGEGSVQSKVVGSEDGKPYSAVLMRKRKEWFEQDQKEKMAPMEEMENQIRRGTSHQSAEPDLREGAYTPDGGNTLSRS